MLMRQHSARGPSGWRGLCAPLSGLRRGALLFLLLQNAFSSSAGLAAEKQCQAAPSAVRKNYHHLVVLVHGYMGSYREQEYLGEAVERETEKLRVGIETDGERPEATGGESSSCRPFRDNHRVAVLNSRANSGRLELTADGIAEGGARLAAEISDWIRNERAGVEASASDPPTVLTLSLVGNSLGGLYSRYALAELEGLFRDPGDERGTDRGVLPLVFCTTSSPHLGVSQETFIELPKWTEPWVSSAFGQQTMDDLFGVRSSTVVTDMCHLDGDGPVDFLRPLGRFQKRIAVANAYNTDFLVSVSSGAFLSSLSDSVHHHQDSETLATSSIRLMEDTGHVALQVATLPGEEETLVAGGGRGMAGAESSGDTIHDLSQCVNNLDRLGWLKIFIDTRSILPEVLNLGVSELEARPSYTSRELQQHFKQYGTVLPIAHPLNMANSKTDWYRTLTKSGQPVVDALAELLVRDMVELSERAEESEEGP